MRNAILVQDSRASIVLYSQFSSDGVGSIISIKHKNKLFKKYLQTKNEDTLREYKAYKNKLTSLLRISEKQYYAAKFGVYKNNLKQTWKTIKLLINRNGPIYVINAINENDVLITDSQTIANSFNKTLVFH